MTGGHANVLPGYTVEWADFLYLKVASAQIMLFKFFSITH